VSNEEGLCEMVSLPRRTGSRVPKRQRRRFVRVVFSGACRARCAGSCRTSALMRHGACAVSKSASRARCVFTPANTAA